MKKMRRERRKEEWRVSGEGEEREDNSWGRRVLEGEEHRSQKKRGKVGRNEEASWRHNEGGEEEKG